MNFSNVLVITLSFAVALGLSIAPLPEWAEMVRPEIVSLVLIYWCLSTPTKVGVGVGWTAGLMLDVAKSSLLGQHALALAALALITQKLHNRIRVFPIGQQSISIMLLVTPALIIVYWIRGSIGQSPASATYWLTAVTSGVLWPVVFALMSRIQHRYKVS